MSLPTKIDQSQPTSFGANLPPRRCVLGIGVDAVSLRSASTEVIRLAEQEHAALVCLANVHMLVTALESQELKSVMENAELVLPDGMPLVRQLRKELPDQERVAGYDLMVEVLRQISGKNLPVSFIGSSEKTLDRIRRQVQMSFPEVKLGVFYSPPFFGIEAPISDEHMQIINELGSGLIFVGLGCPKQEIWMNRMRPYSKACMVGVGAAFHLLAGDRSRAPQWMRNYSLEWVYRLLQEPTKLFGRYVITNSKFILRLISLKINYSRYCCRRN